MASLTNYTANGQKVVQLFAAVFNAGATGDLIELGNDILDTASLSSVIDALLDKDTIKQNYPMYAAYVTDAAFVDQLIDNMSFNSGVASSVTDGWKAYVTSIADDYASRGALVEALLNFVVNYAGADADLLAMQTVIDNRAEVSAFLAQNGATTYTSFSALMNEVKNVDLTADSVTAAEAGLNLGDSASLTTGQDNLEGSALGDLFTAHIFDTKNTLQSGDVINGGSGTDRLEADIGTSQLFAITPETTSVEQAAFRAEALNPDSSDNNISADSEGATIDAQRMEDVTRWEDNNSRSDLIIEDVRINDDQITSDITIAMVETDPGHVDFGVYFDQYSLRAGSSATSQLEIQILDTRSEAAGTGPLLDNPYWGFAFYLNGVAKEITSTAIDDAQTYNELKDAINAQIAVLVAAGDTSLAGFSAALGDTFGAFDTLTGAAVSGTSIVLTDSNGGVLTTDAFVGWQTQNGTVPASSGLHTDITPFAPDVNVDLVTSKIILDDVGRGSTGGDLVVGGLSVGDTSSSKGVERFEITVLDNSKLQTINSTNNTLEEVTIVNGATSHHGITNAYSNVVTAQNAGNLTVNGTVGATVGINTALPGSGDQHDGGFGFSDVRLIDGSAMTGKLAFTAEITDEAIAKYVNLTDTATDPAADNIAVQYDGGTNNDTMVVSIDGDAAGSHSNVNAGREDFTFDFNGNAGNDSITVAIDSALLGNTEFWYTNQKLNANITVDGGAGNDTIRTPGAGDMIIGGGAGDDTIYVDNTGDLGTDAKSPALDLTKDGSKAVWVFNTSNQSDVGAGYVLIGNDERNLADLESSANTMHALYKAELTVDYKGLTSTVTIGSTGYITSDLQINQALKDAINGDAVLSKLLAATDGPANTLVVTSLIDGVQVNTDLDVAIDSAAVVYTATEAAAMIAAWQAAGDAVLPTAAAAATGGSLATAVVGDVVAIGAAEEGATVGAAGLDYFGELAESGTAGVAADTELVGAASLTTSDNTVTGGSGNDVIVLGTTVGGDAAASVDDSNDTVVYNATSFGNDTIVHFTADAGGFAGADMFDFSGLSGFLATAGATFTNTVGAVGVGAVSNTDDSIMIDDLVAAGNDTTTLIKALFTDNNVANSEVYITVDTATNIGSVYTVVDGTGATDLAVTLVGTIDLADTAWSTLTATNFA